jgi:hypothetical protein
MKVVIFKCYFCSMLLRELALQRLFSHTSVPAHTSCIHLCISVPKKRSKHKVDDSDHLTKSILSEIPKIPTYFSIIHLALELAGASNKHLLVHQYRLVLTVSVSSSSTGHNQRRQDSNNCSTNYQDTDEWSGQNDNHDVVGWRLSLIIVYIRMPRVHDCFSGRFMRSISGCRFWIKTIWSVTCYFNACVR